MDPLDPASPNKAAWHDGKTVGSIRFVQNAEAALAEENDMSDAERRLLIVRIEMLKRGALRLDDEETVDEWLEQLRHHRP